MHKLAVIQNSFQQMLNRDKYWKLPLVIYFAMVISSLISGLTFTPQNVVRTTIGLIGLLLLISIAHVIRYSLRFAVFYLLARIHHKPFSPGRIFSGIILCDAPMIFLIWVSLLLPGFAIFDQSSNALYTVTSLSFYLRHSGLTPVILNVLSVLELFNLAKLMLLSLVLQSVSNFNFIRCFVINMMIDFSIQLIPF